LGIVAVGGLWLSRRLVGGLVQAGRTGVAFRQGSGMSIKVQCKFHCLTVRSSGQINRFAIDAAA
jgi:hypothetical protein